MDHPHLILGQAAVSANQLNKSLDNVTLLCRLTGQCMGEMATKKELVMRYVISGFHCLYMVCSKGALDNKKAEG